MLRLIDRERWGREKGGREWEISRQRKRERGGGERR